MIILTFDYHNRAMDKALKMKDIYLQCIAVYSETLRFATTV